MKVKKLYQSGGLQIFKPDLRSNLEIPFFENGIKAGFPSPAEDFKEQKLDLNIKYIKNPSSTFFALVDGDSMKNSGLDDGDLLIVDRSLEPKDGKIAVCYIDGEFTVKRLKVEKNKILLMPENEKYKPIEVKEGSELVIWGCVKNVIKDIY
jgi:DNA polymerase V